MHMEKSFIVSEFECVNALVYALQSPQLLTAMKICQFIPDGIKLASQDSVYAVSGLVAAAISCMIASWIAALNAKEQKKLIRTKSRMKIYPIQMSCGARISKSGS